MAKAKKNFLVVLATVFILVFLPSAITFITIGVMEIRLGITYNIEVGGHLKRAADSTNIELAEKELGTALENCEKNKWTEGTTSIFWETPDTDIAFWYQNILAAKKEIESLSPNSSSLEKSNMLIKLRETLVDHESKGDVVTAPSGVSAHPYNVQYFYAGFGSFIMAAISLIVMVLCIKAYDGK